tara:strand:+ start:3043 stop:3213 length:171 start_codon:yes stop_codon:yes gene_type:complete
MANPFKMKGWSPFHQEVKNNVKTGICKRCGAPKADEIHRKNPKTEKYDAFHHVFVA